MKSKKKGLKQWLGNFDNQKTTPKIFKNKKTKIHRGFYEALKRLKKRYLPFYKEMRRDPKKMTIYAGHSRGGGIATIAGFQSKKEGIPTTVFTMGSPKVGNKLFVQEYSSMLKDFSYRYVYGSDFIPHSQPLLKFKHVPNEFWESSGKIKFCKTLENKPWKQDRSCSKGLYRGVSIKSVFKKLKRKFKKMKNGASDHMEYWGYKKSKAGLICLKN
jgi:hypothetical protein